jgi:hypothetical protein
MIGERAQPQSGCQAHATAKPPSPPAGRHGLDNRQGKPHSRACPPPSPLAMRYPPKSTGPKPRDHGGECGIASECRQRTDDQPNPRRPPPVLVSGHGWPCDVPGRNCPTQSGQTPGASSLDCCRRANPSTRNAQSRSKQLRPVHARAAEFVGQPSSSIPGQPGEVPMLRGELQGRGITISAERPKPRFSPLSVATPQCRVRAAHLHRRHRDSSLHEMKRLGVWFSVAEDRPDIPGRLYGPAGDHR